MATTLSPALNQQSPTRERPVARIHERLPDLLPDLVSGLQMVHDARALMERGVELDPELFAFRVGWERWTVLHGPEASRFFFRLTDTEVDPFEFRMRLPTLALPGVRVPKDMHASSRLTKTLLAEQFQREGLDNMIDAGLELAAVHTSSRLASEQGTVDDMFELWLELCGASMTRAMFGQNFAAACPPEFLRWYVDIERRLDIARLLVPWWPSSNAGRAEAAMQQLISWLRTLVAARRRAVSPPDDMLQGYVRDGQLDDDEIVWTVNSALWAGFHYPAVHAFWSGVELLSDERLRGRLLDEQGGIAQLNAKTIGQMPLLRGCVLECLRMHPLAALPRRVRTDLDFRGAKIPAGSVVAMSPYLAHHDPAAFPEPHRFDPERWLPGQAQRPPMSFLPGGSGRWGCVAIRLTVTMLTGLWAQLLRGWSWERIGLRPKPSHGPLLMPPSSPLQVSWSRR